MVRAGFALLLWGAGLGAEKLSPKQLEERGLMQDLCPNREGAAKDGIWGSLLND